MKTTLTELKKLIREEIANGISEVQEDLQPMPTDDPWKKRKIAMAIPGRYWEAPPDVTDEVSALRAMKAAHPVAPWMHKRQPVEMEDGSWRVYYKIDSSG